MEYVHLDLYGPGDKFCSCFRSMLLWILEVQPLLYLLAWQAWPDAYQKPDDLPTCLWAGHLQFTYYLIRNLMLGDRWKIGIKLCRGHWPYLLPSALTEIMTKSNLGKKGFLWFTLSQNSLSLREAKAGAQAKVTGLYLAPYGLLSTHS